LGWEKGIVGWVVSDSGGIQKSLMHKQMLKRQRQLKLLFKN
jgi:hypothetical protein